MSKSASEEYVAIMQAQLSLGPQPGERWKHYRGGEYEIVCRSVDEATLVQLVTYRSVLKGFTWTRNLTDFMSMVSLPGGYGQTTERFYRISEATNPSDGPQNVSSTSDMPPDSTGCSQKPLGAPQTAYGSPTIGTPCKSLHGVSQCHDCRRWFRPIEEYELGMEPMLVHHTVLCRTCYGSNRLPFIVDRIRQERRTRSQVLFLRDNFPIKGGCCSRFADQMGCYCLELAIDDSEYTE